MQWVLLNPCIFKNCRRENMCLVSWHVKHFRLVSWRQHADRVSFVLHPSSASHEIKSRLRYEFENNSMPTILHKDDSGPM
jgi:hypothetical protein